MTLLIVIALVVAVAALVFSPSLRAGLYSLATTGKWTVSTAAVVKDLNSAVDKVSHD